MIRPSRVYPNNDSYELVIYDLRYPGTPERLRRERAAWQGQSVVEALDRNHAVLVVRPGGARRLAV
jgi:hypothetical protein